MKLHDLQPKINEAISLAFSNKIEEFREADAALHYWATIYSKQITACIPESNNITLLQMTGLKHQALSVFFSLFFLALGMAGAVILTNTYLSPDLALYAAGAVLGAYVRAYGWAKSQELFQLFKDNQTMSVHNQSLRIAMSNAVLCLHAIKDYEFRVQGQIEQWHEQGLLDNEEESDDNT